MNRRDAVATMTDSVNTKSVPSIDSSQYSGKNSDVKEKPKRKTKLFNFRIEPEELDEFKRAAEREGFNTVTQWLLWHLRRIVHESTDRK